MRNFFDKFSGLELVAQQGLDVRSFKGQKLTVVLNYEQMLFYSVSSVEEAKLYRQLGRRISKLSKDLLWQNDLKISLISQMPDVVIATSKADEVLKEMLNSDISSMVMYQKEAEINRSLRELRESKEDDPSVVSVQSRMDTILASREVLEGSLSEIPVSVSPKSPIPNLLSYGAMHFTTGHDYDVWQGFNGEGPYNCISFLTDEVLDALEDYENDQVGRVIIFAGLYGYDAPFQAARRISNTRNFDEGIVQVYCTGYHDSSIDVGSAVVLRGERESIVQEVSKLNLPPEVVKVYLPPGGTIRDLNKEIEGKK
jgi:hypothetical protein